MPVCSRCKVDKPVEDFHKSKPDKNGLARRCKPCAVEVSRNWRAAQSKEESYEFNRTNTLKRLYGLTKDLYDILYDHQEGKCLICAEPKERADGTLPISKILVVDHKHGTKHVRGLLCQKCNLAVGQIESVIDSIDSYVSYIKSR